jgi:glycosyltransferase involved in cell wall biosynthesis
MAMELPAVATDVGGIPELLADGETGLLAPSGDDQALARAVIRLLSDEALRVRYGRTARRRVEEKFDFSARVRTMEDIYCWVAGVETELPAIFASQGI